MDRNLRMGDKDTEKINENGENIIFQHYETVAPDIVESQCKIVCLDSYNEVTLVLSRLVELSVYLRDPY